MGNDASSGVQRGPKSPSPHNIGPTLPSNARLMNTAIKQRLSKGTGKTTYNMKVVIRGDRQTGKSALFHRLEGGGFIKEHRVTEQIQCSHVLWPYKTSDEMVNLEIWDVVDKAIIPTNIVEDNNGIIKPSTVSKNLLPADATTIDVYKGAHAVIFMVDPTRKWTLDYVKSNVSQIPDGIDCVVLFGKKDLSKIWTMTESEIEEFKSSQPHNVRTLQISLQDCYGMKELHSFFNVPFLRMKRKSLQQELDRAKREFDQSIVELDIFIKHQNYDEFLQRLKALKEQKTRKSKASTTANVEAPAPKVKQTVRSSKDLPLIQEQQQKEEQRKKEEELKKQEELKKLENIDTFKVTGGLNDDFFADVAANNDDEDHEDEKTEDEPPHSNQDKKPQQTKPLSIANHDDNDSNDEEHTQPEGVQINGHEDGKTKTNGESHIGFDVENKAKETILAQPGKENAENSFLEKIGFADSDLSDNISGAQPKLPANGHDAGNHIKASAGEKISYSRMPDLRINESKSGGKLQSLMKLQNVELEPSESEEYDDEPLVFAAPKSVTKSISPQPMQPKIKPKPELNALAMLDVDDGAKRTKPEKRAEPEHEQTNINDPAVLDALMNDLNLEKATSAKSASPRSPKSPRSVKSNDDDLEEEDEQNVDEAERKRRKEERKRRKREKKEKKKKKKKKKHKSEDEEESDSDDAKKRKKKKKKKKKKAKEKDNDLVENYDDSDDAQQLHGSDNDMVEIE